MSAPENPYESLTLNLTRPPGFRVVRFLAVMGLIAVMFALFVTFIQSPKRASHHLKCRYNLSMISVALHSYASHNQGNFPPAYTVDSTGKPLHSWRTLILPYLDYRAVYDKIDLTKPWNDPVNADAFETYVRVYQCPSADLPANLTTYLAIVSPNSCFRATESRKLTEITDDHGQTLMLVDTGKDCAIPWMSPQDTNEQSVLELGSKLQIPHPGGTNVAWVDGSVGFLDSSTSADERRAMISIQETTSK